MKIDPAEFERLAQVVREAAKEFETAREDRYAASRRAKAATDAHDDAVTALDDYVRRHVTPEPVEHHT